MRAGWQWIRAQTVDHIPRAGFCAGVSRASSILYAARAVWSSYSGTAASCCMKLVSCVASDDAPCCLLFEKCLPNDARLKARQFGAVGGDPNCCARRGGADWRHCTMAALPDTVRVPLGSEAMGAWKACATPTSRSHRAPRVAVQVGRGIMLRKRPELRRSSGSAGLLRSPCQRTPLPCSGGSTLKSKACSKVAQRQLNRNPPACCRAQASPLS